MQTDSRDDPGRRQPFEILILCTANMCRSPMAEHLLRHKLHERLGRSAGWDWVVSSAGTHASSGTSVHKFACEALSEVGIMVEGARCRQATPQLLAGADLVLTSTRAQRAWVATEQPGAVRRTFTLRHFARCCVSGRRHDDHQQFERGDELMALASRGRALLQPVSEDLDNIADPIGWGLDRFRRCLNEIDSSLDDALGRIDSTILTAPRIPGQPTHPAPTPGRRPTELP